MADIRSDVVSYYSSYPGLYMGILLGDTLYFSADDGNDGHELWAMEIEHSIAYD